MKYTEIEGLRADRTVVFDLTDHLRRSFEDFCNTYHKDVPFLDAFMGLHNFHKLILIDIVSRSKMPIEAAQQFLQISVDTFQRSVNAYIEERKAERKEK